MQSKANTTSLMDIAIQAGHKIVKLMKEYRFGHRINRVPSMMFYQSQMSPAIHVEGNIYFTIFQPNDTKEVVLIMEAESAIKLQDVQLVEVRKKIDSYKKQEENIRSLHGSLGIHRGISQVVGI